MTNSKPKLLVEAHPSRELTVTVTATPADLRSLVSFLSSAIDALPSPLESTQRIYLKGFEVADARGSKQETYLVFCAEPSLDWLATRRRRRTYRDWVAFCFLAVILGMTFIGFCTVMSWLK
jgi:hypothetical protein